MNKHLKADRLNFVCVVGNLGKIWSAFEQHEIQFTYNLYA